MNVLEGLQTVRRRLEENGAGAPTLTLVDQIIQRASLPAAKSAESQSLLQLVRMLMRHPTSASNVRIYNDLVRIEDEIDTAAAVHRERQALEDAKPVPKTKKYYKDLKDKEKKPS